MVRPDGIPEDIWSAAKAAYVPGSVAEPKSKVTLEKIVWIANALLAERDRCAVLVRDYPEVISMWSRGSAPPGNGPPRRATQAELAEAIRKGAP
jgi:hypothetical protein